MLCKSLAKAFTGKEHIPYDKIQKSYDKKSEEKEKLYWFKHIDANGNGHITKEELYANLEL